MLATTACPLPARPALPGADYARVERALRFLVREAARRPSLVQAAQAAGLSEFHFQRLFRRWAGVTPKQFLQFLGAAHARRCLEQSRSVLDATFAAGLSSPGRLHDLMIHVDAVSPGEFRSGGVGLRIRHGVHATPFGQCLLALTERGLCSLEFVPEGGAAAALQDLAARWPRAALEHDPGRTAPVAARIFHPEGPRGPFSLLLRGTNFQIKVWEALLRVPPGRLISYGDLARRLGAPGAARAVGQAVGGNPIAYLIPCHRVIRSLGMFGDYRGGALRKRAILGWEAARGPATVPTDSAGRTPDPASPPC